MNEPVSNYLFYNSRNISEANILNFVGLLMVRLTKNSEYESKN
jgi:hypothetical protein